MTCISFLFAIVSTLYGHGENDQIIILAPSSQQTPVFVDRVGGADFHNFDHKTLYERVKIPVMIDGLSLERERLSQWRSLRKEQEKNLKHMEEKDSATTDKEGRSVHMQNEDSPDGETRGENSKRSQKKTNNGGTHRWNINVQGHSCILQQESRKTVLPRCRVPGSI